jgi:hypothetical protein
MPVYVVSENAKYAKRVFLDRRLKNIIHDFFSHIKFGICQDPPYQAADTVCKQPDKAFSLNAGLHPPAC